MDHVVYLDAKAKEQERIVTGEKQMIVRGAAGRKLPYGRVSVGDRLYFVENNAEGVVRLRAVVSEVYQSEKVTPDEARAVLESHQGRLGLTTEQLERWGSKRYLVLIAIRDVEEVDPFKIDRSAFGNMDDWLLVEDIQRVR